MLQMNAEIYFQRWQRYIHELKLLPDV
jgi:hypothetical protein